MHFADMWEALADAIPQRTAIVQGARRVSWASFEDRSARLASFLEREGVGLRAAVGLYLYNCPEYLEAQFAAFKGRSVPINVNYRYLDNELAYLLENADVEALVFHSSLADRVERIRARLPKLRLLIEVDDGAQHGEVHGSIPYEAILEAEEPATRRLRSAGDLYMLYTGGTTGMPKGVMYRIGDLARSFLLSTPPLLGLPPITDAAAVAPTVEQLVDRGDAAVSVPGPPLMHGTGVWMGAMAPHTLGSTVALLTGRSFDGHEMLRVIETERGSIVVIVGDAFARPLLTALDERVRDGRPADVSSLKILASSGAMLSAHTKERLLQHAPNLTILDLLGSSEGGMGGAVTNAAQPATTAKFVLNPGVRVLRDDDTDVTPGAGEVGSVALTGAMVPIGYYKDPAKSAKSFREIGGVRYSFPGDMATVDADGSIHLLGRGSSCINTGGEKVFPEEVEEAIKSIPAVADCLVVGIDDDRFGQIVAAVVSLDGGLTGAAPSPEDIRAHVKRTLSGYKAPRHVAFTGSVPRAPNGKADYVHARELALADRQRTT